MTKYRGCIDIHSGKVKQIVGGTLREDDIKKSDSTKENFVSDRPSIYYANLYKDNAVQGCHVIKLGTNSENDRAAQMACQAWPLGLQIGGGINEDNALQWLDQHKASHVIVTSWLFRRSDNRVELDWDKLKRISKLVGKGRLIVDLSCRTIVEGGQKHWYVAIDKWQTITNAMLSKEFLEEVSQYCDEFLIHAADVEGLCRGIDKELVITLGDWCPPGFEGKIVYAGGANSIDDLNLVKKLSKGKLDLTYGSALDIFGGNQVKFEDLIRWNKLC